jgi:hypothetical protein
MMQRNHRARSLATRLAEQARGVKGGPVDKASLMQACATGHHYKEVTIEG